MTFKKAETEIEKEKLKEIPDTDFLAIGHDPRDYELDYDSFKEHERLVKEYLRANNG